MADIKKGANEPFLYDDQTDRITGLKNSDATEKKFVYTDGSSGPVVITDTTASTSTTTGALRVTGGVGIGGAVNIGGAATVATNLTLSNGNLILGTAGNGISFAATTDPTLTATKASGAIIRTATNVANNDTVTIGTTVYTFKTTLTPANYEVLIGADASASLTNLRHAILGAGGTPGTDYQVPAAHPTVTALAISGSNLPLEAITAGTAGNSIALAETAAELSVSASTLLGGAAVPGMTSELLDDYETGTFTPRYIATGGTLLVTQDISEGRYTKIGNLVTINIRISTRFVDRSGASGELRITGFPYLAGAYSNGSFGSFGVSAFSFVSNENPTSAAFQTQTELRLYRQVSSDARSGHGTAAPSILDQTNAANRNFMFISGSYFIP